MGRLPSSKSESGAKYGALGHQRSTGATTHSHRHRVPRLRDIWNQDSGRQASLRTRPRLGPKAGLAAKTAAQATKINLKRKRVFSILGATRQRGHSFRRGQGQAFYFKGPRGKPRGPLLFAQISRPSIERGSAQGLDRSDANLLRRLRSSGTACDVSRPLPCPLRSIAIGWACERFAGTSDGVSMTVSCRRDMPSNCAFSSIARER